MAGIVNEWVKQAILMYFGIQQMKTWTSGPLEFYDKMELKKDYASLGGRALPPRRMVAMVLISPNRLWG